MTYEEAYAALMQMDAERIAARHRNISFTRAQRDGIANGDRPKQIMAALKQAKRQMSAKELADELDISVESVREAIRWPIKRGEVNKVRRTRQGGHGARIWYEVAE